MLRNTKVRGCILRRKAYIDAMCYCRNISRQGHQKDCPVQKLLQAGFTPEQAEAIFELIEHTANQLQDAIDSADKTAWEAHERMDQI